MAFVIIIIFVAIIAIVTGGNIKNLKNIRFRLSWLVFIPVLIKIVTNSDLRYTMGITDVLAPALYIGSMALITIFIILNINLRGFVLVGVGLICNLLAISANGGFMPVKREYLEVVASAAEIDKINQGLPVFNYIASGPGTKFYYLSDIFLMPHSIFITRIFSVGDVLITIGGSIFVWTYIRAGSKYEIK